MWIIPISVALSAMGAVNGDFLGNSRSGQHLQFNFPHIYQRYKNIINFNALLVSNINYRMLYLHNGIFVLLILFYF